MVLLANCSQFPEQHHDRFSRFCRDDGHVWQTDRDIDRPCYSVRSNRPHLANAAMRPDNGNNQQAVKVILQKAASPRNTDGIPYTLQLAAPSHGESGPPPNTWLLGPTWVHKPKGISIVSTVFAGLMIVRDRQTDRQTMLFTLGCFWHICLFSMDYICHSLQQWLGCITVRCA